MTTLDPEKLDRVKTVVVHENCADGTASAILIKDAFPGRPLDIRFMQYGTDAYRNLQPEPGMLFCDISPPAETAQAFVDAGALILDHHKTAKAVAKQFGDNGVFGDEAAHPGVCGAVLAYRHVWWPRVGTQPSALFTDQFAQDFSVLAGIRDTWQRQDPRWRDACVQVYVLDFIPNEMWLSKTLDQISASWASEYKPLGEVIYARNAKGIDRALLGAHRFTTSKGTRVVTFDGLKTTSDAAEQLGDTADLIVGFMPTADDGQPKYLFSTRTRGVYDCAKLAKAHGGGGHTKAAGFQVAINPATALNPYAFVEALVERHENQP
jgi:oligoribonuclease NrnB/cAMP/cGMP phosphodiesterase (DHH superfamily)